MAFLTEGVNWIPWITGGISFVLTLLCTPVVIKVAYKFNWIAQPKKDRWHSKPTALMGGIAPAIHKCSDYDAHHEWSGRTVDDLPGRCHNVCGGPG